MNKRTYEDFLQTISRSPTEEECAYLATHMRQEDIEEARACGALSHDKGLLRYLLEAVSTSDIAVMAYETVPQKPPVAIYGAVSFPTFPNIGFVWMHGTRALGTHCKQDFLRLGRFAVEELREQYQLLVCFADIRNTLHTRWLRWCGFTPINKYPICDPHVPFLEFILPGNNKEAICAPL